MKFSKGQRVQHHSYHQYVVAGEEVAGQVPLLPVAPCQWGENEGVVVWHRVDELEEVE